MDRNECYSILTGFLVLLANLLGTLFLFTWSFIFRNRYPKDTQRLLSLRYSFVSSLPLRWLVSSGKEYGRQCKGRPAGLQSVGTLQCSTNSTMYCTAVYKQAPEFWLQILGSQKTGWYRPRGWTCQGRVGLACNSWGWRNHFHLDHLYGQQQERGKGRKRKINSKKNQ